MRRANVDELSIHAAGMLKRTGSVPSRPVGAARPASSAAEARPTRELPLLDAARQQQRSAEPSAQPAAGNPRQALDTLRQAVSQLPPDPAVDRALQQLGDLVDRAVPAPAPTEQPIPEKPVADLPATADLTASTRIPATTAAAATAAGAPTRGSAFLSAGRGVLKKAPGYAMNRLLSSLASTAPDGGLLPGAALDLQG